MLSGTTQQTIPNGKQNPYVFIVGCPRSGTTLLRRIVGAHPSIAIMPETHWIDRYFNKGKGLTPEGSVTPKLISRMFEYGRFPRLKISWEELEQLINSEEPVSYATFVTGIFNLFGKGQGKPLVGDKTPEYVRSLALLHSLWPSARFVHLISDGRDVCLSVRSWKKSVNYARRFRTWNEDPISTTAVWWQWNVQVGRDAGRQLGPRLYYEIRYESLMTNPAREAAALCKFLDVPYDEAIIRFYEGRTRFESGLSSKDAWLPITPGLRDWRKQMSVDDLERFEAVAGDLLDELGYVRAFQRPSAAKLEYASRIHELFTQDTLCAVCAPEDLRSMRRKSGAKAMVSI